MSLAAFLYVYTLFCVTRDAHANNVSREVVSILLVLVTIVVIVSGK